MAKGSKTTADSFRASQHMSLVTLAKTEIIYPKNPAHLPQNWAKLAKSAVLFSWYSSKMAPRIFIFSIVLGAEYLHCC